ncbi:Crp/Fnr family transcriptional regulator [Crocinitomicaceae bacterium]|nr:Crp/Fnr family transcriptional regulator [Crocinitomicaceae bacterium]MDC3308909.1 Crp/Fnr family transcriptional regulator [Crocinitomicaceae bacterium]
MKKVSVKKGDILQYKGDVSNKIYSVEKGLLRTYSIDEKGKEHIFMFAPEGWIVADASTINGPADLFIEAMENSELIVQDNELFVKANPIALIKRIAVLQKRAIMLMSATAIDRYQSFIETYPNIVQRVPQKMIASYLGITPEALSKAKGDRVRSAKRN